MQPQLINIVQGDEKPLSNLIELCFYSITLAVIPSETDGREARERWSANVQTREEEGL